MATRLIRKTWSVENVLTNVTTAKLSDPTGTYGVKRNDTSAVVVADGTAMTNSSTGVYEYSFTDTVGIAYTAYVEFVYSGATYHFEVDIPARATTGVMVASYSSLFAELGEQLFGIITGFSADQTNKIDRCIKHGLNRVYDAHDWSFFRPVETITTSDGTSAYSLPTAYESIESELDYAEGESDFYPPVRERHDSEIRKRQADNDDTGRPLYFSVRTVEFDPTVGSRRQLILCPTPDATYVLSAKMTLRRTMIDETNQYPVGGEQLGQLILEACLSAAEMNYDDAPGIHSRLFAEMLPVSIASDQRASTPRTLGGDAPAGEHSDIAARSILVGTITFDGTTM
jgi:hypothetical protein